jgi:regulator of sigma E protease
MVVIHEFGHFIVAKLFGIRVETFSVGFGKRIWGFKRGDTDYRLSLIPLGGYVKMAGENLDEKITGAPDEFMSKPKWQRFCVAVAGPAMNILTALMIPAVIAMVHHEVPAYVNRPALVKAVEPESPAEAAGLKPGDLIVSVEGVENPTWRDVQDKVLVNFDHDLPLTI